MKSRIDGKKCFITGGAGFIGSHLAETLLKQGASVDVYDNLSTGRKDFLQSCMGSLKFNLVVGDLLDAEKLQEKMKDHDIVWHLGANTNMVVGNKNPDVDFKNGIVATFNVLNSMKNTGVKEIVFASSGAVYGDISHPPAREDYGPLLPVSTYGAAKLAAEGLISCYFHMNDIRSWIFRFGNVLGKRMTHGVIYDLLAKLQTNTNELEVLGDGKGEKNYFLVEECIDGMIYAYSNFNRAGCEIFNLGSESTTRVSEIARIVLEETGNTYTKIRYTGGTRGWPGDQPCVYMSVDKMRKLGWSAKHTSTQAVRTAVKRYLGKV
jgi:UDP-glucose 4-epimerase